VNAMDELIDMVPVGMQWLVRSTDEGDFLANITDRSFVPGAVIGPVMSVQGSFMARGETPHVAFRDALSKAMYAHGLIQ
jgi:hypothetical protein